MPITEDKLQKILAMIRIKTTEEENKKLSQDLDQITKWIEKIEDIDVKDMPPFMTMSTECNRFLDQPPIAPLKVQEALMNAPQHDGAYFCVPPMETKPPGST